jgi:hypothetical protein
MGGGSKNDLYFPFIIKKSFISFASYHFKAIKKEKGLESPETII